MENVQIKETICSVLHKKKLLSDEEYAFETNDVAILYDEFIFRGYLFVLYPLICILKKSTFLDTSILFLVHIWMDIHLFQKNSGHRPNFFLKFLASLCVFLAGLVGRVLYLLKP